jgi:hypothetical protein
MKSMSTEPCVFQPLRSRRGGRITARDWADRPSAQPPFREFGANAAWLQLVLIAVNLLAWTLAAHRRGAHWEPKLRYALLHVAARVRLSGRRVHLRLQRSWRWSALLCIAFPRVRALPIVS